MTITNGYITAVELKRYLGISDVLDDQTIDDVITDASRSVDVICGRRFYLDGSASAKLYARPIGPVLYVDDFNSGASLTVADNGTTLSPTLYQVEQNVGVQGVTETWAAWSVRLLGAMWTLPVWPGQATITVTATWGWPSVPGPVKRATYMQAAMLFQSKDTRLGVAGFDAGIVRLRENTQAMALLKDYVRADTKIGIA